MAARRDLPDVAQPASKLTDPSMPPETKSGKSKELWARKNKWLAFYNGTYAPHLSAEEQKLVREQPKLAASKLPWRSGAATSTLREFWNTADGKTLQDRRDLRALEMGCGTGENLTELLRAPARFSVVVGVDIAKRALETAEAQLPPAEKARCRLVCDGLHTSPAPHPILCFALSFASRRSHLLPLP
jgi:SAM-dependent methyltransferase